MRHFIIAGAAAITLCSAAPAFAEQPEAQDQSSGYQVQANPPGEGIPAVTPPDPQSADSPVAPAMPADSNYHAGPYKGALTPPPPQAMDKAYPLCTRVLQDSCVNPGEAGAQSAVVTPKQRQDRRSRGN